MMMHDSLPSWRRDLIEARLAAGEPLVAAALASEFGVSDDSIRRDLRALAALGKCKRTYGGALPISPASTPISRRIGEDGQRKEALARCARALIVEGEALFLDSGSTNLALAAELPVGFNLTVITNAIAIAAALLGREGVTLVVVGGEADTDVGGCVGASAVLEVQRMSIDRCFLGACAVSAERGISAFNLADATFKRTLVSSSRQVATLALTEKLETTAPHVVAPLGRIQHVIVEDDAPLAAVAALRHAGTAVMRAGPVR